MPIITFTRTDLVRMKMKSLFSNNLVHYKPHSLASCGVGSTANSRLRGRRT